MLEINGFQNSYMSIIIGVVGCMQVKIKKPKEFEDDYINIKEELSINVQVKLMQMK